LISPSLIHCLELRGFLGIKLLIFVEDTPFYNNYYIPLIFALISNKTLDTYKNMFKIITEKCNKMKPNEKIRFNIYVKLIFVANFEKTIHNVVYEMFPLS
jgi:hypothetical protein